MSAWSAGQIRSALEALATGDMAMSALPERVSRLLEEIRSRFPDLDVPDGLAQDLLRRPAAKDLWWLGAQLEARRDEAELVALLRRAAEGDASDAARPDWYASRYVAYALEKRGAPAPDDVVVGLLRHRREPARLAGLTLATYVASPSDGLFEAVVTIAKSDDVTQLRPIAVDVLAELAQGRSARAQHVAISDALIDIAKTGLADARAAAAGHLPWFGGRASDVAVGLVRDGYLDAAAARAVTQELVAGGRLLALLHSARDPGYVQDVAHAVVLEFDHDHPRNPAALRDADAVLGVLAAAASVEDLAGLLRVALRHEFAPRVVEFVTDPSLPLRVRVAALDALTSRDESVAQSVDVARALAVSTSAPPDLRERAIAILAENSESSEWVALLHGVASQAENPRIRDAALDALRRLRRSE